MAEFSIVLTAVNKNEKQQLQRLSNDCKGIRQLSCFYKRWQNGRAIRRKRLCFLHYTEDPADLSETIPVATTGQKEKKDIYSSSCVICLDSPVEGAFIPCGHMAGCMSCLTEIESKKRGCPVCRTNIDQVIRLYAV
ncbi:Ankyrin repeat-containing protein [Artemisia annua]|uniref:Ankyrin repeat-containing protein n=1 Tax=Artemisia annua TaxID=35608 RepID=A0A2U1QKR2_ARTAN|nr:Ankyrin repeat-containing protein [Artemisia annua]